MSQHLDTDGLRTLADAFGIDLTKHPQLHALWEDVEITTLLRDIALTRVGPGDLVSPRAVEEAARAENDLFDAETDLADALINLTSIGMREAA